MYYVFSYLLPPVAYFRTINYKIEILKDNFSHITDEELLNKFYQSGNNEWLGALLERYTLLLYGTCMKYLKNETQAKDAVQQVYLKAITELAKYKVTYFKSWLYLVAKNYCLMQLRSKGKTVLKEEMPDILSHEDLDIADLLFKEKDINLLKESISKLSEEQKNCITLFYLHEKSYQQIADQTGYEMMKVKSYIQNGKRNLKILMDKKMKVK